MTAIRSAAFALSARVKNKVTDAEITDRNSPKFMCSTQPNKLRVQLNILARTVSVQLSGHDVS